MKKKWGVWAVRSSASVCGAAQSWCKKAGKPIEFSSKAKAQEYAQTLNENAYTPNVHYSPREVN